MEEKLNIKDNVTITIKSIETGSTISKTTHNFITKPGLYHVLDSLRERANVLPIDTTNGFCGLGIGSTLVDYWKTSLDSEVSGIGNAGRHEVDSVSRTSQTVLISSFFDSTEASGILTEVGLFVTGYDSGGNLLTASDDLDSGVMFAKATFNPNTKDTTNSLTIDWEITF